MFSLRVRFLTGRSVSADPANPELPEWPPHPGRLFMALVAAWGQTDRDAAGRMALEALERLPPPSIHVPFWNPGAAVSHFVSTNDKRANPLERRKAERKFPSALPDGDEVFFTWSDTLRSDERVALGRICAHVTYLGHSSSLVSVAIVDQAPAPNLVPVQRGPSVHLRVAVAGRLEQLEAAYSTGERPDNGTWQGYAEPAESGASAVIEGTFAGPFLVLRRVEGTRIGLVSTLQATEALRGASLRLADQPPVEALSGHAPGGSPSKRPHVAFFPLPDVGHPHADGHLLGLAVAIPAEVSESERDACVRAVARIERLMLGRLGQWQVASEPGHAAQRAVSVDTWAAPSRRWATVTPIVLDRFPKRDGDAEAAIVLACERTRLPRPSDVIVMPVSPFIGSPAAREYPALPSADGKPRRWHTHAILTFGDLVAGPVLLGAGRFRGYGLCRPLG